ncbi:MAG: hypothetical protein ABW185_17915, partial [Sedimenticola sp.]
MASRDTSEYCWPAVWLTSHYRWFQRELLGFQPFLLGGWSTGYISPKKISIRDLQYFDVHLYQNPVRLTL